MKEVTLIVMPVPPKVKSRITALSALLALPFLLRAQDAVPGDGAAEPPARPATIVERVFAPLPDPLVIMEDLVGADAGNTVIEIHLAQQRLTVRVGDKLAVDSPATTGRKAAPTPEGEFTVTGRTEAIADESYGDFTDKSGLVLVAGVFRALDAPPRGSRFTVVPRKYALEVGGGKTRILAGHVRSTPSTDGTILVPEAVAWALFEKIPDGATVRILKDSPAAGAAADPAPAAPPAP